MKKIVYAIISFSIFYFNQNLHSMNEDLARERKKEIKQTTQDNLMVNYSIKSPNEEKINFKPINSKKILTYDDFNKNNDEFIKLLLAKEFTKGKSGSNQ